MKGFNSPVYGNNCIQCLFKCDETCAYMVKFNRLTERFKKLGYNCNYPRAEGCETPGITKYMSGRS